MSDWHETIEWYGHQSIITTVLLIPFDSHPPFCFLSDYFSSSLRQSILALQSQHEAERQEKSHTHIAPMKTMVNIGSEFYMKAVVSGESRKCAGWTWERAKNLSRMDWGQSVCCQSTTNSICSFFHPTDRIICLVPIQLVSLLMLVLGFTSNWLWPKPSLGLTPSCRVWTRKSHTSKNKRQWFKARLRSFMKELQNWCSCSNKKSHSGNSSNNIHITQHIQCFTYSVRFSVDCSNIRSRPSKIVHSFTKRITCRYSALSKCSTRHLCISEDPAWLQRQKNSDGHSSGKPIFDHLIFKITSLSVECTIFVCICLNTHHLNGLA